MNPRTRAERLLSLRKHALSVRETELARARAEVRERDTMAVAALLRWEHALVDLQTTTSLGLEEASQHRSTLKKYADSARRACEEARVVEKEALALSRAAGLEVEKMKAYIEGLEVAMRATEQRAARKAEDEHASRKGTVRDDFES